eukprot:gnl/TRDRNA2_/TRDRNA2_144661_c0_seq1.p2 gnl/TRDRNA2_/TRDRNA2_144661_c0~~gnl/TRDRNA2_/TRDRNA2_144661_c0_seq1.p2  ORF type:complete len:220 (+),score=30.48 gnl/TRDRNA2_/TRDRNA2_144661_c0_seq1:331-990(+)
MSSGIARRSCLGDRELKEDAPAREEVPGKFEVIPSGHERMPVPAEVLVFVRNCTAPPRGDCTLRGESTGERRQHSCPRGHTIGVLSPPLVPGNNITAMDAVGGDAEPTEDMREGVRVTGDSSVDSLTVRRTGVSTDRSRVATVTPPSDTFSIGLSRVATLTISCAGEHPASLTSAASSDVLPELEEVWFWVESSEMPREMSSRGTVEIEAVLGSAALSW